MKPGTDTLSGRLVRARMFSLVRLEVEIRQLAAGWTADKELWAICGGQPAQRPASGQVHVYKPASWQLRATYTTARAPRTATLNF